MKLSLLQILLPIKIQNCHYFAEYFIKEAFSLNGFTLFDEESRYEINVPFLCVSVVIQLISIILI